MTGDERLLRVSAAAIDLARQARREAAELIEQLTGGGPSPNGSANVSQNGAAPYAPPEPAPAEANGNGTRPEPAASPALADRSIVDSAHDAFVAMDSDGRITTWNPAAEATFGWTREEALGRTVGDTIVPEDMREAHANGMRRFLSGGEPRVLDKRLEMPALHRDGHTFPIEMTISAVEESGTTSFYAFMHDISARKQEERYRTAQLAIGATIAGAGSLAEAMPAAMAAIGEGYDFGAGAFWEAGEDGRLRCTTFWSEGSTAAELEAASRELELEPGHDLPGVALADRAATWVRKVAYDPDFVRASQAEEAGFHSAIAAPLIRENAVFGVIELFTSEQQVPKPEALDALAVITAQLAEFGARTRAERDAERIKDEFFALVSHELRTPLTSIIGYTDMLSKTESDRLSSKGQQMLDVVRRNAKREMRLVGDLLMLVRIEAGRFELEPGTVDLATLGSAALQAATPAAEKAGLHLTMEVEEVPVFEGDSERVGQVLDNLLSNAIKFTESGGVTLKLRTDGDDAVVEVIDTGPGIPDEDLGRLFDRLYRAASATEGHIPGTGLGLTIVKGIVEAHGGSIAVESQVGQGTTFRVRLPLAGAPQPAHHRTVA